MPVSNIEYKRVMLRILPQGTRFKTHPNDPRLYVKGYIIGALDKFACYRLGNMSKINYMYATRYVFVRK